MSRQSSDMGQDEIQSTNKPSRKRRGPWEVWVTFESLGDKKPWVYMTRDYADKGVAEEVANKYRRESFYKNVEVKYNERKE